MIRFVRTIFLLSAAVFLLAGCKTIGGWFSGDDERLEPAELVEFQQSVAVEQLWSTGTGEGGSRSRPQLRPVLADGLIWTVDHAGRITAVDAQSGNVERSFDVDLPVSSGPTVTGDAILLGTFDGDAVMVDRDSGRVRWRARLSSEVLARPVVHDGVVIVRCIDGRVFGLEDEDGSRRWVNDRSIPLLTLRGNAAPLTRAGQAFFGYDDGRVVALRVADGTRLWEQQVSAPEGRTELDRLADIDGPMLAVGTELYAVTYHGRVAGLAIESGRILWAKDVASASGLSLRRTELAIADRDDNLWLVDRRNGATLWRDETLLRRRLTRPVFIDDLVVVADFEGYLHFFDSDDGEMVARARASKDRPAAAPLVVGNVVYLLDDEGELSAWRVGGSS